MSGKVLAFEEIIKHQSEEDCWVLVSGKVYNVTKFLEAHEHPGGDDVIKMASGKDSTSEFEDVGHSKLARDKMEEFYIGEVDKSTLPQIDNNAPRPILLSNPDTPPPSSATRRKNSDSSKILLYAVPLLILAVSFLLSFYS